MQAQMTRILAEISVKTKGKFMKRTGTIGEDPALISISCAVVVIHTVSWWRALRAILIKKTVGTLLSSSDGSDRFVNLSEPRG